MDKDFVNKIVAARGDAGKQLLDDIPNILKKYEEQWSIKILPPFQLSYNYVAPAITENGTHLVFKLGLHGYDQFIVEHDALKVFNGDGIIKLLKSNVTDNVMLLERVEPGAVLNEREDDEYETHIIASIIKKIPKPIPSGMNFPTLKDWFQGYDRLRKKFNGKTGPLPEKIVMEGEELYKYLLDSSSEQLLLHGDLHHGNILSSHRDGWLAIDPDAVIGERAFETAVMLHNPRSRLEKDHNIKATLIKRISILSEELAIDRERIKQWGVAQNVLSAIWTVEDNGADWHNSLLIAETLSSIHF